VALTFQESLRTSWIELISADPSLPAVSSRPARAGQTLVGNAQSAWVLPEQSSSSQMELAQLLALPLVRVGAGAATGGAAVGIGLGGGAVAAAAATA
jgi:hypothetical protein